MSYSSLPDPAPPPLPPFPSLISHMVFVDIKHHEKGAAGRGGGWTKKNMTDKSCVDNGQHSLCGQAEVFRVP